MKSLSLAALLALAGTAYADTKLPEELAGIDIDDRRGARLPADLAFTDHTGASVKLGEYLDGKHPLILVLAYYQCPMLCSLVLNGTMEGARGVPFDLGDGYRIVTVSFDPRDTVELAAAKRKTYVEALGKPLGGKRPWDFLISDPAQVRALADAVGFRYRWDPATKQFAHAAGIFVFTPDGRLSRVLKGIQFAPRDLRLALVEAGEGKLGSTWDRLLLFCYHYDPSGRGYSLAVLRLVRWAGALTALLLGTWLFWLWRRDRRST